MILPANDEGAAADRAAAGFPDRRLPPPPPVVLPRGVRGPPTGRRTETGVGPLRGKRFPALPADPLVFLLRAPAAHARHPQSARAAGPEAAIGPHGAERLSTALATEVVFARPGLWQIRQGQRGQGNVRIGLGRRDAIRLPAKALIAAHRGREFPPASLAGPRLPGGMDRRRALRLPPAVPALRRTAVVGASVRPELPATVQAVPGRERPAVEAHLTSVWSLMASRIFSRASSSVSPSETQPGKSCTEAE